MIDNKPTRGLINNKARSGVIASIPIHSTLQHELQARRKISEPRWQQVLSVVIVAVLVSGWFYFAFLSS